MSKPIDSKTVSIYDHLKKKPSFDNKEIINFNAEEIYEVLNKFYANDEFIKIFKFKMINTNEVINTNKVNISINNSNIKDHFVISSSIDNLLKGAAGQAIQNFNIRFGFDEQLGLV